MMQGAQHDSPAYIKSVLCSNDPYAPPVAPLASVSSQSIYSNSTSQASDDSVSTAPTSVSSSSSSSSSVSDPCDSFCLHSAKYLGQTLCNPQSTSSPQWKRTAVNSTADAASVSERKPNPRRTRSSITTHTGCPPALVRQSDRKVIFVDSLVDCSTQLVETIWPLSSVTCRSESAGKGVLPLRTFIQETLRRSRTSYSTLQVALYYLILVKPHIPTNDFTMEQPDDVHANRVLQCGRRMFLAALILASKYLQDRNFSARAWSKISGLNTHEINQNETAFLAAVNWQLHITGETYHRWTEIVLKFTPNSQPPSPGSSCQALGLDWKQVVKKLNPDLDSIEGLTAPSTKPKPEVAVSPLHHHVFPPSQVESMETSHVSKSYAAPLIMEPTPAPACSATGRLAPALGLLPTPRLTPKTGGYNTPAVSAATMLLNKTSMGLALAQASSVGTTHTLDRWPASTTSSPCYMPARRSSLATSVSSTSSPESMISDTSMTSRSSSISSVSSLVSAPPTKLDVMARCRYAKLRNEGYLRPTIIASVTEEYGENCITSSPESYDSSMGRDLYEIDEIQGATDAARALQALHHAYTRSSPTRIKPSPVRAGSKRNRSNSTENTVQECVRELLHGTSDGAPSWSTHLVRSTISVPRERSAHISVRSPLPFCSKRLCCPTKAFHEYSRISNMRPMVGGPGGPGMWRGVLAD